jgi:hypothetical protein
MIQDYTMAASPNFNGGGVMMLSSSNSGPVAWQAPNPTSGSHRYIFLLFEQPDGFTIPASMLTAATARTNFDLKDFIQQANLPLPSWGNYFAAGDGAAASSVIGGGAAVPSVVGGGAGVTTTYTTATTFPDGGPTQSFLFVTTIGVPVQTIPLDPVTPAAPSVITYATSTTVSFIFVIPMFVNLIQYFSSPMVLRRHISL